jgi:FkbM family methyltransferase
MSDLTSLAASPYFTTPQPPAPGMDADQAPVFISYAQHAEDVLLWRCLREVKDGFYIDVGAFHPLADSVTQAFYERGWRGINIEPVPGNAASFPPLRPRDVNLAVAVSDSAGESIFYEVPGSGLSTFDGPSLDPYRQAGWTIHEITVPTLTFAEICRQHAPETIHFLKVDAELHERQVFASADFSRFRPWLILVESVLPMSVESVHQDWEPLLLQAGYEFLYFDGLNRYYASQEKVGEMRPHLNRPANPVDRFKPHVQVELEEKVATLTESLRESKSQLKKTTAKAERIPDLEGKIKALEQRLQHHAANPIRALKLWWNRQRKSKNG